MRDHLWAARKHNYFCSSTPDCLGFFCTSSWKWLIRIQNLQQQRVMEGGIPDNAFQTVLISLVVVRDTNGRFVSTHEHDGWYLPAGRYFVHIELSLKFLVSSH